MAGVPPMRPAGASRFERLHARAQLVVRYLLAFIFISYGVAKLLGTQFIRAGMTLDHALSELSGFELTWAYFGYSPLYSHFIALGQITFAALLLFQRTARLGMLGLLPIVLNIVLVNFAYNISVATTMVSCVFLAMNLYLVLSQAGALKAFFWDDALPPRTGPLPRWRSVGVPAIALVVMMAGSFTMLSLMKRQLMNESPLNGDWVVQEFRLGDAATPASAALPWEKVYFQEAGFFGARTAGGLLHGRYLVSGDDDTVEIRYDPRPFRRGAPAARLAADGAGSADAASLDEIQSTLRGRYHLASDRSRLAITGVHDDQPFEIVLAPWVWPKF